MYSSGTRLRYTANIKMISLRRTKNCIKNSFIPFIVGGLISCVLDRIFNLVNIFGNPDSYVYYYTFSTIVQSFFALIAFLGMLAIYKLQRYEDLKRNAYDEYEKKIENDHRSLTIELKEIVIVCLFNIGLALIGIPLIPYFNLATFGPIYLGGNIVLSIWVLRLSYPIIQKVLQPIKD